MVCRPADWLTNWSQLVKTVHFLCYAAAHMFCISLFWSVHRSVDQLISRGQSFKRFCYYFIVVWPGHMPWLNEGITSTTKEAEKLEQACNFSAIYVRFPWHHTAQIDNRAIRLKTIHTDEREHDCVNLKLLIHFRDFMKKTTTAPYYTCHRFDDFILDDFDRIWKEEISLLRAALTQKKLTINTKIERLKDNM